MGNVNNTGIFSDLDDFLKPKSADQLENQPTRLIIAMGPPGSGKGTQCSIISKNLGLLHISTGDMCRELVASKTEMGYRLEAYLKQGNFVPDSLMIEILQNRLKQPDAVSRGVILDGFPRTAHQARVLVEQKHNQIERFILLQATDEICVERILGRRIDPITGESYHIKHYPPPENQEYIGQRLIRRELDIDEEIIRKRLENYHTQLGVLLQYFKGKVQVINGNGTIDEVTEALNVIIFGPPPVIPAEEQKKPDPKSPSAPVEQCVVCMSNPADYLVIPCGHQCGCEICLRAIQTRNNECPICRQPIQSLLKVYRTGIVDDNILNTDGDEMHDNYVDSDLLPLTQQYNQTSDGGWGEEAVRVAEKFAVHQIEENISQQIKVDIAPCAPIVSTDFPVNIAITITLPDLTDRIPVDICCVVDISGSMGEDATFQDPNNENLTISDDMSQLDIVKHAVKAIMYTLTDQDRLAIVAFEGKAVTVFSLSEMNTGGRTQALISLEKLQPEGSTDIWAGLLAGLEALRTPLSSHSTSRLPRKKSIILLTDGQPNKSPPESEQMALHNYFESYPNFHCQVNTFGFGYNLNSRLLLELSIIGRGTFSFIPDAKIVGTCFISAVANACSTLSQNCKVHLMVKNHAQFSQVHGGIMGNYNVDDTSWGKLVDIGSLQYGQSRDLVVALNLPKIEENCEELPYLEVVVEYDNASGELSHKILTLGSSRKPTLDSMAALMRNEMVTSVYDITDYFENEKSSEALNILQNLEKMVTNSLAIQDLHDDRILGLQKDICGRIDKAVSTTERFNRWGQHYLRAITRAHQLQIRTNFMDPGLQFYGGSLFKSLEDISGKIFVTLELKKRTDYEPQLLRLSQQQMLNQQRDQQQQIQQQIQQQRQLEQYLQQQQQIQQQIQQQPAAVDNTQQDYTYYAGSGGGCFANSSTVMLYQPKEKNYISYPIHQLKKGDFVKVTNLDGTEGISRVDCLVVIQRKLSSPLVEFKSSGLKITQNHPIRMNGHWYRPKDMLNGEDIKYIDYTDNVYNMILDKRGVLLMVNGIECVTFGHEIEQVYDQFYGTEKVIHRVSNLPGWEKGMVTIHGSLRRSPLTEVQLII